MTILQNRQKLAVHSSREVVDGVLSIVQSVGETLAETAQRHVTVENAMKTLGAVALTVGTLSNVGERGLTERLSGGFLTAVGILWLKSGTGSTH